MFTAPSLLSDTPPCSMGGVVGGCASGTGVRTGAFRGRPLPRLGGGDVNADAANAASVEESSLGGGCAAKDGAREGGTREFARVGGAKE